jgi:macrodomain Ter protein organizer (MatP/YcbG family)
MTAKITSLKIDPELWKKVKLLAVKRGITLKSLIEELLILEVEGEEFFEGETPTSKELLTALEERRRKGTAPFVIKSKKSAVELVREGRGE